MKFLEMPRCALLLKDKTKSWWGGSHTKNECCYIMWKNNNSWQIYTQYIGGRRLFIIDLRLCNTTQREKPCCKKTSLTHPLILGARKKFHDVALFFINWTLEATVFGKAIRSCKKNTVTKCCTDKKNPDDNNFWVTQ